MRKRSKYRPKAVLRNPMGFLLDGFAPMSAHAPQVLTLKIKNHHAMVTLLEGKAKAAQMGTLVAMYNMVEALHKMGFGAEYAEYVEAGMAALASIVRRSHTVGKYVPTGPEIQALNQLMELHDAQMEVVTVRDVDRAIKLAKKEIDSGRAINLRRPQ